MGAAAFSSRFLRFILAGGLAAGANYGSRFAFSVWFSYEVAILLAYLVGMTVAFVLMRAYVFEGRGKAVIPQAGKFALVNVLAVLQTLVISLLLARWGLPAVGIERHAEAIAHFVGVLVPVATSYAGHRFATFR